MISVGNTVSQNLEQREGNFAKTQLYTMDVPEIQNHKLAPSDRVGRGTSQQSRFNPSLSDRSRGPRYFGSIENISPANTSLHCEQHEYSETDFLLPNKLYGSSRFNESERDEDTDGYIAPAETVCSIVLQILVPFLLAGLGTVSAGMLLDVVQVRNKQTNKQKKTGEDKEAVESFHFLSCQIPESES